MQAKLDFQKSPTFCCGSSSAAYLTVHGPVATDACSQASQGSTTPHLFSAVLSAQKIAGQDAWPNPRRPSLKVQMSPLFGPHAPGHHVCEASTRHRTEYLARCTHQLAFRCSKARRKSSHACRLPPKDSAGLDNKNA